MLLMVKSRKRSRGARAGGGLERVKFFVRASPADVEVFRAVRDALAESEGRRVLDAEVFRLAMRAAVAQLPADVRARVGELSGGD